MYRREIPVKKNKRISVRFEVLKAVAMKITILYDVTLYSLVEAYLNLGKMCFFYL
jgi:hypothetical protein